MARLPHESPKRRKSRPQRQAVLAAAIERDGGCVLAGVAFPCSGRLEGHEIVPRGRLAGSHLILDLVRMLCHAHHAHATLNPHTAERWGVMFPVGLWDQHPDRVIAWHTVATAYARQHHGAKTLTPWWWPEGPPHE